MIALRLMRVAGLLLIVLVAITASACGGGGEGAEEIGDTTTQEQVVQGDASAGRQVFVEQGCGNCHTFTPAGPKANGTAGPSLDQVVRAYDAGFIRESIIDPSAYIEKMKSGVPGSIKGETPYRDTMPATGPDAENEQNRISEQELADLVAFLTAPR